MNCIYNKNKGGKGFGATQYIAIKTLGEQCPLIQKCFFLFVCFCFFFQHDMRYSGRRSPFTQRRCTIYKLSNNTQVQLYTLGTSSSKSKCHVFQVSVS